MILATLAGSTCLFALPSRPRQSDSLGSERVAQSDAWDFEAVELLPRRVLSLNSAIALDGKGDPHMTYVSDGMLMHAFKMQGVWATEVVDTFHSAPFDSLLDPVSSTAWFSSVARTSVAISGDDIHVAYLGERPPLRYARKSNGSWSTEIVDERASSDLTMNVSIAVDAAGNPSISYCGYPSCAGCACSLKYASRSAGQWSIEVVGGPCTGRGRLSGQQSALSVDGDVPHVVTVTNRGLCYASKDVDWFAEAITDNDERGDVSLALDSTGRARVAWLEKGTLRLARRTGSGEWVVEAYSDSIDPFWNCISMDVDATDTAHILLSTMTTLQPEQPQWLGPLKYLVQREAGSWDVETIDDAALGLTSIFRISLTLDDLDRPHISYVRSDKSRKTLIYAFRP
jgi:hypothetical protein